MASLFFCRRVISRRARNNSGDRQLAPALPLGKEAGPLPDLPPASRRGSVGGQEEDGAAATAAGSEGRGASG